MWAEEKQSSILSLNSSRCSRALSDQPGDLIQIILFFCAKKKGVNNKSTANLKVQNEQNNAVVHAEKLRPGSHIISLHFLESVTWDRKLCELVLSSLIHRIHAHDQCNFAITFAPFLLCCGSERSPVCVAEPEPQARGAKDGFIVTAFHSRKAENASSNWYAPFYPLHRPDNVSQRENLTSSRLDPTEQHGYRAHAGRLLYFL